MTENCIFAARNFPYLCKHMMKIPPFLEKGQTVAVVSPAGRIRTDCLERAVSTMRLWGLDCHIGKHVASQCGPCAGSDEERLQDLQKALDDPDVKAIIGTRGGYGSARIIDRLDFSRFLQNPKWMVGFSDITVFHSHLQNLGVASLHACMPQTYPAPASPHYKASVESLRKALFGETLSYSFESRSINRAGSVTAPVAGGNLSILYSLRGTVSDLHPDGKILFLEDLDEFDYHIDRMLLNLKRGGWFERIAGLMVGAFTSVKKGANPWRGDVWDMIKEYTEPYSYPVCYGFPAGHVPYNHALYMGVNACLQVSDTPALPSSLHFQI